MLCHQDAPIAFRENQQMGLGKVLLAETIYSDAKQGKEASAADIALLGPDPFRRILLEGHVSLSTEERRRRTEARI